MKRCNFPNRKAQRRADAEVREIKRSKRTDKTQLRRLVRRGHGHCAEAQRLRGSR